MSPAGNQDQPAKGAAASQTPLERLLDVGLYAPLGLLANRNDVVRDLAVEGRKQIAFSRSLGRAALKAVAAGARSKSANSSPAAAVDTEPAAAATISDYSSLTAREIIALIPSCSAEQRAWIEATEQTGKARVTILRALKRD